jgi:pilus assembly protein CpaB
MGKYRPFIFLGIAIIVALITSILIYNFLQKKAVVKEVVSLETQPVAVAVVDLSWGTALAKEMIRMEPYLKKSLPEGSFPGSSSLEGRVVISTIKAGEPVLESRLAPRGVKTGGVAAIVSPKKRAMAVKVDKVIGVSGYIYPGNRVDVLVTLTKGEKATSIAKTVLENILVLAVGAEKETKGKEEKPSLVDVITLEVTPVEGEKLALAATEGKLLLALRNFSDTEDVLTRGATVPALLSSYTPVEKTRAVRGKRVTTREVFRIELIKGSNVSEIKL